MRCPGALTPLLSDRFPRKRRSGKNDVQQDLVVPADLEKIYKREMRRRDGRVEEGRMVGKVMTE